MSSPASQPADEHSPQSGAQVVWRGKHFHMAVDGRWEFATRPVKRPAVGIVAVTSANALVLVEQLRPPVGRTVMELPAGLTGDVAGAEDEPLLVAAQRELLEETGYIAERWTELGLGYSSPGLTDESIVLFLARDLTKVGAGGGDASEEIVVHEAPIEGIGAWLAQRRAVADFKLFAGLYLMEQALAAEAAASEA
jgi:ADP-ribose pyrophosphatase